MHLWCINSLKMRPMPTDVVSLWFKINACWTTRAMFKLLKTWPLITGVHLRRRDHGLSLKWNLLPTASESALGLQHCRGSHGASMTAPVQYLRAAHCVMTSPTEDFMHLNHESNVARPQAKPRSPANCCSILHSSRLTSSRVASYTSQL